MTPDSLKLIEAYAPYLWAIADNIGRTLSVEEEYKAAKAMRQVLADRTAYDRVNVSMTKYVCWDMFDAQIDAAFEALNEQRRIER